MGDVVKYLGRVETTGWKNLHEQGHPILVCSYFATGHYDPSRHDPEWLDGVLAISRMEPDRLFVKASYRSAVPIEAHVDPPGYNYIWAHSGQGFCIDGELLDLAPGDVIRFKRDHEHEIRVMPERFLRTNLVGQADVAALENWNAEFPTTCWFQNGEIYDRQSKRPIPW